MISNPPNLMQLQRAMIFIDGTNLFHRLIDARIIVPRLDRLFSSFIFVGGGRQITRIYLYTIAEHRDAALRRHGDQFLEGIRVVLGDGIKTKDGNIREKAVDALLVADLIYHAASRNCDYAVLVSVDTDFAYAIRRVEDFGCRTAVLGIVTAVPDRLKTQCDECNVIPAEAIVGAQIGTNA